MKAGPVDEHFYFTTKLVSVVLFSTHILQEGLTVASIARDDLSTLPGDDPFPRACMHRDRNAR